jgi:hypothetical protein
MVITLEGGYNLSWIGKCFLSQVGALVGTPQRFDDSVRGKGNARPIVKEMKDALSGFWDL